MRSFVSVLCFVALVGAVACGSADESHEVPVLEQQQVTDVPQDVDTDGYGSVEIPTTPAPEEAPQS